MPGKYRQLLVACDLEGRSRQPVAESLGIPEGTLSSRLTAARKMLANRLARRGIAPAVVAGIAASGPAASATEVPRAVLASTARIGTDAAGTVPAAVAILAKGAIRAMTITRLTTAAIVLFGLGLLTAGAVYASGLLNPSPANLSDSTKATTPVLEEKPLPVGPNRILYFRASQLTLIDPDGKNEKAVSKELGINQPGETRLSPDGKMLATLITMHTPTDPLPGEEPPVHLHIRGLDEKEPGTDLGIQCKSFCWSPDGTEIAYSGRADVDLARKVQPIVHRVVNVKTKAKTSIKLPDGHEILDWSRDGEYFLTRFTEQKTERKDEGRQLVIPAITLHLMNRDGTEYKCLTDPRDWSLFGRLSPDGKRVLYLGSHAKDKELDPRVAFHLWVLDIASGKVEHVDGVAVGGVSTGFCWSPDGKRISYAWRELPRLKGGSLKDTESEFLLVVCDPDGTNAKTIVTEKRKGDFYPPQGEVDWR